MNTVKNNPLNSAERIAKGIAAGELKKPTFDRKSVAAAMQRNRDLRKRGELKSD